MSNPIITFVTPECTLCREYSFFEMENSLYTRLQAGEKVQEVFPHWSLDEREMLLTGTHTECWDKMFAEEDD